MHSGFIKSIDLFQSVDDDTCARLAQACTKVILKPGELLIQAGASDTDLYLLESGSLQVVIEDGPGMERVIRTLQPGSSVGETALLTGAFRSASVRAAVPSELYRLTRVQIDQIANTHSEFLTNIEHAILDKIHNANLTAALFDNQLFGKLDADILRDVRNEMQLHPLKKGDRLVAQDEPSDSLYLIVNGQVRVFRQKDTETQEHREPMHQVTDLGRGQTVGETGFLTGEARNASVYALRDTLVARLDSDAYFKLLRKYPEPLTRFFSAQVLAPLVRPIKKKHHTIALIGLNPWDTDHLIPIDELAKRLKWHIENPWYSSGDGGRSRSATYINEKVTDQQLGEAGISGAPINSASHLRLQHWFAEQEAQHECLIFGVNHTCEPDSPESGHQCGEQQSSNWLKRISHQVEQVVFVVDSNTDCSTLTLPACFNSDHGEIPLDPGYSLALLHTADCEMPAHTAAWLAKFNVNAHHHIRWSDDEESGWNERTKSDVARVARLLTGEAIGLVLSGGAARGFAHLGVVRAMHEAGVPIDILGGTSAGAISASIIGAGYSDDQAHDLVLKYGKRENMNDYTLPTTALFKGKRFSELLRKFVGDVQIEDLWLPFYCVSINMTDASEVVHRQGPLWKYVRASASLPIMLPPVADGEKLLVDGAMLNAMPVEIMSSDRGCGTVIGIDVSGGTGMRGEYHYGTELSGWQQLMRKFNPMAKPHRSPTLPTTILAISAIGAVGRLPSQRAHADLHIRPPVHRFKMMDYDSREQIMQVGYEAAKEEITGWLDSRLAGFK